MLSVHLFQPQYASYFSGQLNYWLPYSVGCIWAYAQQYSEIQENFELTALHYRRRPVEEVLNSIDNPTVAGFSCYNWNEEYCLEIARAIKKRWPQCVIVFGGPQTGFNHSDLDFIDSIVMAEGEYAFVKILQSILAKQKPETLFTKDRLVDLEIPSPYLLGLFDNIIKDAPGVLFNTVIETNRGCPFKCTFCDWGSLTYSKVRKFDLVKVEKELEWIRDNPIGHINVADANFGIFKERDLEIAKLIHKHLHGSSVDYVQLTYTKNSNDTVFEIAKAMGSLTKSVTLSMQSMNPATLTAIKRDNLKSNNLQYLLDLSEKYKIPTHTEMILGLPEETLESWRHGLCELLEAGQHNHIETYFTNMIENAELNQTQKFNYNIKTIKVTNYQPWSLDDNSGIPEYTDLVTSTSTMTIEDMYNGYMWSWLIQNFHQSGYSQLITKYCRQVLGISYRTFYDNLLNRVLTTPGIVQDLYNQTRTWTTQLLTRGNMDDNTEVHFLMSESFYGFFKNPNPVLELVFATANELGSIDPTVIELQRHAVYSDSWPGTSLLSSNFDIQTWKAIPCQYQVTGKVSHDMEIDARAAQLLRRRGLFKNQFVEVSNSLATA